MQSRSHFYQSADGLRLHIRIHGALDGRRLPVVCLPGLTRNARDFEGLAEFLIDEAPSPRPVVAFDYRGRGLSDYDPEWRNYNPSVETQDVLTGLATLGIDRAAFIGTSRGGLILHLLANKHPEMLEALVLNDVGPELGLKGLAQIRQYLLNPKQPSDWPDAVSVQQAIHGPAFPALSQAAWERFARALYRERDGKPVPDFDPALVRTLVDLDLSKPLPHLWLQFEALKPMPLLVIRGENSKVLESQTVAAMSERHPSMRSVTAFGQGHAPLLDTEVLAKEIGDLVAEAESKK